MSKTLTKSALAEHLRQHVGITKKDASDLVDSVLGLMREVLAEGEKIKIDGFGSFEVRHKSARRGRNPQTGEDLIITRRRVVTFKPSSQLRDTLNEG